MNNTMQCMHVLLPKYMLSNHLWKTVFLRLFSVFLILCVKETLMTSLVHCLLMMSLLFHFDLRDCSVSNEFL